MTIKFSRLSIFTGKIKTHFRCFHVFVARHTTTWHTTTGKHVFYMLVVDWDVLTTNGTNRIVIVPKASETLNHYSYGHISVLTMTTWFLGLLLNDSFRLVRLAITFRFIAFRLTFLAFTTVATVAVIITSPFVL